MRAYPKVGCIANLSEFVIKAVEIGIHSSPALRLQTSLTDPDPSKTVLAPSQTTITKAVVGHIDIHKLELEQYNREKNSILRDI